MKQIVLFYFSSLLCCDASAQQPLMDNLWMGTGKFILGTDKLVFAQEIKLMSADSVSPEKDYIYEYLPVKKSAFSLAGVHFNTIFLFFDGKNKLRAIEMIAKYPKTDSTDYFQETKDAVQQMIHFMKGELKQKAMETAHIKTGNYFTTTYQWKKKNSIVLFRLLEGKIPGHEFFDIDISFRQASN